MRCALYPICLHLFLNPFADLRGQSMKTSLLSVIQDFVSLFFPRYCLACELALVKGEDMICTGCLLELPRSGQGHDQAFFVRLHGRLPLQAMFTLYQFSKGSRVQHLLHALKYRGQADLGVALGRLAGHDLRRRGVHERIDLIVSVPLQEKRKRVRGYNQSERFAHGLAEVLQIPCCDTAMRCVLKTQSQTRRGKLQRWLNVKDSFEVTQPGVIAGQRILLVDDVITTGATAEACGLALLAAGCKEISVACIAGAQ
jgi:ComF family protein